MILKRNQHDRFSTVSPLWGTKPAVVLAGGPSLTVEQVEYVRQSNAGVIAVNDTYLWAPWADVCYFGDSQWWEWQTAGVAKPLIGLTAAQVKDRFNRYCGQKCSIEHSGSNIKDDKVHMLRNLHYPRLGVGLSLDPSALVTGKNSGFAALNLAVLAGAKRIVLLGFDARPAADGKRHWFGDHPKPSTLQVYEEMRKSFSFAEEAIVAAGVEVFNCSPGSGLDSFPKVSLETVL